MFYIVPVIHYAYMTVGHFHTHFTFLVAVFLVRLYGQLVQRGGHLSVLSSCVCVTLSTGCSECSYYVLRSGQCVTSSEEHSLRLPVDGRQPGRRQVYVHTRTHI